MQEEEDQFVQIIRASKKKLVTLNVLANFFNHPDIVSIQIRTQIIHNLFEGNRSLDTNKLDLFHIQYTSSLIDLLQKLKRQKEQHYIMLSDEIYINDDFIVRLKAEIADNGFVDQGRMHARSMSVKIEQLYTMFVTDQEELFSWNEILEFSNNNRAEYYREIDSRQYAAMVKTEKKTYENSFAKFEKKLLGRLNIFKFKIKFVCGLVYDKQILEVFEFRDTNDKFVFSVTDKAFFFVDENKTSTVNFTKNTSVKEQLIRQLELKNIVLKEQTGTIKGTMPDQVHIVLKEYLDKISSVDFLEELQNVDEQTNILKAMLNININSK